MERQVIVIVGAGPTGLTLAAELKRLGIPSLILDRQPSTVTTSRALAVHARTLEVLEPLEVTSKLISEGSPVYQLNIQDHSQTLATVSFKDLDTKYPYVLMCPQEKTEKLLQRRLEELGGTVERSSEVQTISPQEKGVEVTYKQGGQIKKILADWVIGCDGLHSIVREQAHIPFPSHHYDENFVLADVEIDGIDLNRQEGNLYFSPQGIVALIPLPINLYRIIATAPPKTGPLKIEDFAQILNERGPKVKSLKISNMVWASQFHIQHGVVSQMVKGHIILAGDAAHVHSPAGGQGMNIGIQDAITLASALKEVLATGNKSILDTWQTSRLAIANDVIKMTDQLTKMATTNSYPMQKIRNTLIQLIGHIPFIQKKIAEKLSELNYR